MITALYIISFLGCFGFIAYAKIKYPDLTCVSESYYKGLPFTVWCIFCGITMLPVWLEVSDDDWQFMAFLSCVFFIFLGTFPRYLKEDGLHHLTLAVLSIALALVWFGILCGWWNSFAVFFGCMCIVPLSLFYAEVASLLAMYAIIIYEMIK